MTDATIGATGVEARTDLADTGIKRVAMHILVFVIIIGVWELAGVFNQLNDLLLPAPSVIMAKFLNMWLPEALGGTGRIYYHFFITLWEAVAGFFIGVSIGVSLAVTAAVSPMKATAAMRNGHSAQAGAARSPSRHSGFHQPNTVIVPTRKTQPSASGSNTALAMLSASIMVL